MELWDGEDREYGFYWQELLPLAQPWLGPSPALPQLQTGLSPCLPCLGLGQSPGAVLGARGGGRVTLLH